MPRLRLRSTERSLPGRAAGKVAARPLASRAARRWALAALLASACRGEGEILDLSTASGVAAEGQCALEILDSASELEISRALTSDWGAGSCYELTITNLSAAPQVWWVLLDASPAGTRVTDRWNHSSLPLSDTLSEWRGIASSNNLELAPGGSTVVGTCLAC